MLGLRMPIYSRDCTMFVNSRDCDLKDVISRPVVAEVIYYNTGLGSNYKGNVAGI